jgi:hypothetical protein
MRTALLAASVLVALSPPVVAQDRAATTPREKPANPNAAPNVRVNDSNAPGGSRLHYDIPCSVSSEGTCIKEWPLTPPNRPRP